MNHNKCGGKIILDCSSMYSIGSPSISISSKGISPGPLEINSCKKKEPAKLMCAKCQETFSEKDEYEKGIVETCSICGEDYPPSEIKVSDNLVICIHCIERSKTGRLNAEIIKDRILMYYGQLLSKSDFPTLLTILMKK